MSAQERETLGVGDRLISITTPGQMGWQYKVSGGDIHTISLGRLPGPMGYYLVAVVVFTDDRPDALIPLHMAEKFEVQNP